MNLANFSCLLFWSQNVAISPDQNVNSFCEEYIIKMFEQFNPENYTPRLEIVKKHLSILSDFVIPECLNVFRPKFVNTVRPKYVGFFKQYII